MRNFKRNVSLIAIAVAQFGAARANNMEQSIFFLDDTGGYVGTKKRQALTDKWQSELSDKQQVLETQKAKHNLLSIELDEKLSAIQADRELLDISRDENCLLNQLTTEEVGEFGNLSAAIYSAYYNKVSAVKKSSKKSTDELELELLQKQVNAMEGAAISITDLLSSSDVSETKALKKIVQLLNNMEKLGVSFDQGVERSGKKIQDINDLSAVNRQILRKKNDLEGKVRDKEIVLSGQNATHAEQVKRALRLSATYGDKYEAKHVLYRNNGEFSGLVLYNKDENRLVFSMAGSKSVMDWYYNFNGWNGRLNNVTGTLAGMHVHSGFASHFNDVQDSWGAFIRSFMKTYKEESHDKPLEILGTGHSLGGALAEIFTLSTVEVAEKNGVTVGKRGTVTFGGPNVFNAVDLEEVVERMGGKGNFIRIQDKYDPVPHAAFWRNSPGVVIRGNAGLFSDEAGAMALPMRLNPHSSGDYAAFATKVFNKYKTKLADVKVKAEELATTDQNIMVANSEVAHISKEAHKTMMQTLATQEEKEFMDKRIAELSEKSDSEDELSDTEWDELDQLEDKQYDTRISHDIAKIAYFDKELEAIENDRLALVDEIRSGRKSKSGLARLQTKMEKLNTKTIELTQKKETLQAELEKLQKEREDLAKEALKNI